MPNNINLLMQTVTDELDSSSLNKTYLGKKIDNKVRLCIASSGNVKKREFTDF